MYYANADQRWYGDNGMSAALKIPIDSITCDGRREIPVDAFCKYMCNYMYQPILNLPNCSQNEQQFLCLQVGHVDLQFDIHIVAVGGFAY